MSIRGGRTLRQVEQSPNLRNFDVAKRLVPVLTENSTVLLIDGAFKGRANGVWELLALELRLIQPDDGEMCWHVDVPHGPTMLSRHDPKCTVRMLALAPSEVHANPGESARFWVVDPGRLFCMPPPTRSVFRAKPGGAAKQCHINEEAQQGEALPTMIKIAQKETLGLQDASSMQPMVYGFLTTLADAKPEFWAGTCVQTESGLHVVHAVCGLECVEWDL